MLVKEKTVAAIWQDQGGSLFVADNGWPVLVICPGRERGGPGCDFRDAVLLINGVRVVGHVEIHVTSDLWKNHGHNRDGLYNGVVLHVAMWHNGGLPAVLQNGAAIPTIILSQSLPGGIYSLLEPGNQRRCGCPHATRIAGYGVIEELLDEAGLERFAEKAKAYYLAMLVREPEQVLYKGIARALGYSMNCRPFEKLADMLPLKLLRERSGQSIIAGQALLFGVAGLLPSQRQGKQKCVEDDGFAGMLEMHWNRLKGGMHTLCETDWRFEGVMPANYPTRRLAGLGYLLCRHEKRGLPAAFSAMLSDITLKGKDIALEQGIMVYDDHYWALRYDFGLFGKYNSALIGQGKAAEIAINIILPFFMAYGGLNGMRRLKAGAEDRYRRYPASPGNELTRYMEQMLGLEAQRKTSACRQQGLLHIYHSYCRLKQCWSCPVFRRRTPARV